MYIDFNFINGNLGTVPDGNAHVLCLIFAVPDVTVFTACPLDANDQFIVQLNKPSDAAPYDLDYGNFPAIRWHIDEVFRLNPNAELYVGALDNSTPGFNGLKGLVYKAMIASNNRISHFGVEDKSYVITSGKVSALYSVMQALGEENRPAYLTYAPDLSSLNLSALPDLRNDTSYQGFECISVDAGMDTFARAHWGATSTLGTILGHKSRIGVHQSLAYPAIGNIKGANYDAVTYYDKPFVCFDYPTYTELLPVDIETLSEKGYIFPRKVMSVPGTFFSRPYSLDIPTGDYTRMQRTMVRHKAQILVHRYVAPELEGDVYFKANGQISPVSITFFEEKAAIGLQQMLDAGEISAYSVKIPQGQLVLQTGQLICNLEVIPVGTAEVLKFNYKYVTAIS